MADDTGVWEYELQVRVRGYGQREALGDAIREAIASAVRYKFNLVVVEGIDNGTLIFADVIHPSAAGGGGGSGRRPDPSVCPDIAGRDL